MSILDCFITSWLLKCLDICNIFTCGNYLPPPKKIFCVHTLNCLHWELRVWNTWLVGAEDKMLSAHEFWPYREIEKGLPHLHPRWHADSGQGCRLISLVSAIMVSAAALGCAASRSHFWRCGHLGHYCATTANSTGSRQQLSAARASSPHHPQPPLPLLSTTSRPFLTWACPACEPSWWKRQRLSRVIHVYRIRLFGVVLQSFILEINS